jgi:hypothetical protein
MVYENFNICWHALIAFFFCGLQESESEEDILDEGDDDVEEEHDHEPEAVHPEPVVKKTPEVPLPPKETERQLSKKERKKKELAELEALLADFGVAQKDSNGQDESLGNSIYMPKAQKFVRGANHGCLIGIEV